MALLFSIRNVNFNSRPGFDMREMQKLQSVGIFSHKKYQQGLRASLHIEELLVKLQEIQEGFFPLFLVLEKMYGSPR